ncbi:hypothetical protein VAS14_03988 [Photobacterium angustum S14]|uniref:Uncharacterized protein n=1 Tax=Photobacterium angustum (strain S14 / CCUG 15956) TaxID=314292 RepID=Q1ZSY0_PHOAS|nr:hypothetical protein VAS14_03988 [Photobacterium angustum S14]
MAYEFTRRDEDSLVISYLIIQFDTELLGIAIALDHKQLKPQ